MRKIFFLLAVLANSSLIFAQESEVAEIDTIQVKDSIINKEPEPKKEGLEFKNSIGDLNIKLDEKGDRFLKFGLNSQIWLREIDNNPGTLVNGVEQNHTYDAGIRRLRITMQAQLSPAYQIYVQLGINNQSFISGGGTGTGANGQGKKPAIFFMDAYNEFYLAMLVCGWRTDARNAEP